MKAHARNKILARDVIIPFHPKFKKNTDRAALLRSTILEDPEMYNVSYLTEMATAHVGGYNVLNIAGQDFDDASDSDMKVVSLWHKTGNTWITTIKIADRGYAENKKLKKGALRVIIVNPPKDRTDYFFIQKNDWLPMVSSGLDFKISISFNEKKDSYNTFDKFRVKDYDEMCKKGA